LNPLSIKEDHRLNDCLSLSLFNACNKDEKLMIYFLDKLQLFFIFLP